MQTALQTELLRTGSIVAIISMLQWIAVYTRLEPWWRRGNPVGHSLVLLALMACVTPALFILALFFHVNRLTSQALAWTEIVLLFAYLPAMGWRTIVWIRISRAGTTGRMPAGKHASPDDDSG